MITSKQTAIRNDQEPARQIRHQRRGGFTLLETLLAISLIGVLMVAIVGGTSLYAQYRSRSLQGNRQAKVLRGTVEDLRNDLRACYPGDYSAFSGLLTPPGVPTEQSGNEDGFGGVQEQILNFSGDEGEQAIHFVGRRHAMLIRRNGANPRFNNIGEYNDGTHRQVLWLAPSKKSIRLPRTKRGTRVSQHEFRSPFDERGLQRAARKVNASGETVAPRRFSLDRMAETWTANSDVKAVEFRYFVGSQWTFEWDSHLNDDRIPSAVEVNLTLHSKPSRTFRIVIRLPSANDSHHSFDSQLLSSVSGPTPR